MKSNILFSSLRIFIFHIIFILLSILIIFTIILNQNILIAKKDLNFTKNTVSQSLLSNIFIMSQNIKNNYEVNPNLRIQSSDDFYLILSRSDDVQAWLKNKKYAEVIMSKKNKNDILSVQYFFNENNNNNIHESTIHSDLWIKYDKFDKEYNGSWPVVEENNSNEYYLLIINKNAENKDFNITITWPPKINDDKLYFLNHYIFINLFLITFLIYNISTIFISAYTMYPIYRTFINRKNKKIVLFFLFMISIIISILIFYNTYNKKNKIKIDDLSKKNNNTIYKLASKKIINNIQISNILNDLSNALNRPINNDNLDIIKKRVQGIELELRIKNYELNKKSNNLYKLYPLISKSFSHDFSTISRYWPRVLMLFLSNNNNQSSNEKDLNNKQALILSQDNAQENYRLTHTVQILPENKNHIISFLNDREIISINNDFKKYLLFSPNEALSLISKSLLLNGSEKKEYQYIENNIFIQQINNFQKILTEKNQDTVNIKIKHDLLDDTTKALFISGHGALVASHIKNTINLIPKTKYDIINLGDYKFLADGLEQTSKNVEITFIQTVLLYVPIIDNSTNKKIIILGASQGLTNVNLT